MTPAGTSNELDVQNEWEENTHTHTHYRMFGESADLCFLSRAFLFTRRVGIVKNLIRELEIGCFTGVH